MAASRNCPRWELFFRHSSLRRVASHAQRDASQARRGITGNSKHLDNRETTLILSSSLNKHVSTCSGKATAWLAERPRPQLSYPYRSTYISRSHFSSSARTHDTEAQYSTDQTIHTSSTPQKRKKGRPPGAKTKRPAPSPLVKSSKRGNEDDVGIPFGFRRDVAGKWKELAQLDTENKLYHRNIWWLWIGKCNEVWTQSSFDLSQTWRQQDLDKRMGARESIRQYVYKGDILASTFLKESDSWKDNVKRVLGSDTCIDFKLIRIHESYRRAWRLQTTDGKTKD